MMGAARPLRLVPGLYGADEVLTDLPQGFASTIRQAEWVATMIALAPTVARVRAPRPGRRSTDWPRSTDWRSHRRRCAQLTSESL